MSQRRNENPNHTEILFFTYDIGKKKTTQKFDKRLVKLRSSRQPPSLIPSPWEQFGNICQSKRQICFSPAISSIGIWPTDGLHGWEWLWAGDSLQDCLRSSH